MSHSYKKEMGQENCTNKALIAMLTNLGFSKCHSITLQLTFHLFVLQLGQHLLTLCPCRLDVAHHIECTFRQVIGVTVHDLVE